MAGLFAAATMVVVACSTMPDLDREAAVTRVIEGAAGAIDRPMAECYVDRVSDELGSSLLTEGAQPEPEQVRRLTSIRIDCFGVAALGATTIPGTPPSSLDGAVNAPMTHGSDPELDALWDQCAAGSGTACDELFDRSPVRSEYEDFAGTCGFRTQELRCADVYTTGSGSGSGSGSDEPSATTSSGT